MARALQRGRGRGGRGRGRGGMRGRGRGGGRNFGSRENSAHNADTEKDLDIMTDVKGFFLGTAKLEAHMKAQEENRSRYVAAICLMNDLNMEISLNARARALVTAFGRKDRELIDALLSSPTLFGLPEVLKAVQSLDSGRQIRANEKQLKRLETSPGKVNKRTLGKIKSNIDNLTANKPLSGSASGAVCKRIAEWVRSYKQNDLEFFALHMPTGPWKKLADVCHFNPKKDFPQLPWFLPFCYTGDAPEGNMVHDCKNITVENVNELISTVDVPFSHIKQFAANLTLESKARIAAYTKKLDTIIWYYEDLQCIEVDNIIESRLSSGEIVTLPYGKLMERLLIMKLIRGDVPDGYHGSYEDNIKRDTLPAEIRGIPVPFFSRLLQVAEAKLKELSLPLEPPIIVMGDSSTSMEVAIRTATIISSVLTAITSAELVFFNDVNEPAPFVPKDVEEVLKMALTVQTDYGTAPAASLYELYDKKKVVKTIIMVTDEEENTRCHGYRFAPLYKKYHDKVYPARLVFISFLNSQHAQGQMVRDLEEQGFHPTTFKLEGSRPDLTKLDTILGSLSTNSDSFDVRLNSIMERIEKEGLKEVFTEFCVKDSVID